MKPILRIALRYLFSSRGSTLLITLIAFLGVFMSVSAILLTMGVFAGFQDALKEKILSGSPHVILMPSDEGEVPNMVKSLRGMPEVRSAVSSEAYNAILVKDEDLMSLSVKLVDFSDREVKDFIDKFIIDSVQGKGIIIGEGISSTLDISAGDKVLLVSPLGTRTPVGFIPKTKEVKVVGVFYTGSYDKDYVLAYMDKEEGRKFFRGMMRFTLIEVYLKDPYKAQEFKDKIFNTFGSKSIIRSWIELNRPLFNALELEKLGLFFVLMLMVSIASFNITSLLFVKVREKMRDIAIMKAYGVKSSQIALIFLMVGTVIGIVGACVGVAFSYIGGHFITEYRLISVPEDIYMMSYVPVHIRVSDTLLTFVGTLILSFLSSLLPALKASRENIISILRNE